MFVHIGKDIMVSSKEIIMILDYHKIKKFYPYQKFLINNKNQKLLDANNEDLQEKKIKSIIITTEKTYYSPIAPATLGKRI